MPHLWKPPFAFSPSQVRSLALSGLGLNNKNRRSAWGGGTGDTSRLQVSAERGRWSKTNRKPWTGTPSQMKDHLKTFSIYFNLRDLSVRILPSTIVHIANDLGVLARSEGQVPFEPALKRGGPRKAPLATDFLTAVSILVSTAVVDVTSGWTGSPTQDLSLSRTASTESSAPPRRSGWISERRGWTGACACTQGTLGVSI